MSNFTCNLPPVSCNPSSPAARPYHPTLSIWLSVDPMSDNYPGVSPYTYCGNNPIVLKDPDGRDWVEREYDGTKEVYYDRHIKSQADVDRKYGVNSGVRYLADGSKVGNGQFTIYNDHKNNIYGTVKDASGHTLNNDRNIVYGDGFVIFAGVTDESLDAQTLHHNYLRTSYTGPHNPQSYNKMDNYDYISPNLSEQFSRTHDLQYADLNAKGIEGALLQTNTWKADLQLAAANAMTVPFNPDPIDRARSIATATAFGVIGGYKAGVQFVKSAWNKLFGN